MVKKQYDSIDLMKFIASIFVVAIHSDPFYDLSPALNTFISLGISRLAVPLFFIASAFFLFKNFSQEKANKYCKRIFKLYIFWFIILLPVIVYYRFIQSEYSLPITVFLFIKSFFFTSTFSGSWYLMSCIFCAILYSFLEKLSQKKRIILTVILAIISYIICVLFAGYGNIFVKLGYGEVYNNVVFWFAKPYTSIIVGIPYFALGKYIANNEEKISNYNNKKCFLFAIICVLLLIAEIYFVESRNLRIQFDCLFMLIPCAYLIFVSLLNSDLCLKHTRQFRMASTIVFFSQFIWLFALEVIEYLLKIEIFSFLKFIIAVFLGIASTFVISRLQEYKAFKWLKYLY